MWLCSWRRRQCPDACDIMPVYHVDRCNVVTCLRITALCYEPIYACHCAYTMTMTQKERKIMKKEERRKDAPGAFPYRPVSPYRPVRNMQSVPICCDMWYLCVCIKLYLWLLRLSIETGSDGDRTQTGWKGYNGIYCWMWTQHQCLQRLVHGDIIHHIRTVPTAGVAWPSLSGNYILLGKWQRSIALNCIFAGSRWLSR